MYKVEPYIDSEDLDELFDKLFEGKSVIRGLDFVLKDNEKIIGIATLSCKERIILRAVAILPEYRKKGLGDFLTRSVMNGFTLDPTAELYIGYIDKYYEKFGFVQEGEYMKVAAKDIVFPAKCH